MKIQRNGEYFCFPRNRTVHASGSINGAQSKAENRAIIPVF
jgi:hypothetical protein